MKRSSRHCRRRGERRFRPCTSIQLVRNLTGTLCYPPLSPSPPHPRLQHKPLHVIASGVTSEKAVVLTSRGGHFKTLRELTECMRASMLLPGITGPMVSGWDAVHRRDSHLGSFDKTACLIAWWREEALRRAAGHRVHALGSVLYVPVGGR